MDGEMGKQHRFRKIWRNLNEIALLVSDPLKRVVRACPAMRRQSGRDQPSSLIHGSAYLKGKGARNLVGISGNSVPANLITAARKWVRRDKLERPTIRADRGSEAFNLRRCMVGNTGMPRHQWVAATHGGEKTFVESENHAVCAADRAVNAG